METIQSIPFDEFGPEKIIVVHDPKTKMKGYVVVDNTSKGPAKGGIRMAKDVTLKEVFELARAMTWKTALAELPFGGGKSGIVANPNLDKSRKEAIIRSFARKLKGIVPSTYIAAPDIGTDERDMAVFADELDDMRVCTGKPMEIGGLPHELGFTGFGVYVSIRTLFEILDVNMQEVRFAIEGFGEVGSWLAKFLHRDGCKIVAVSDSKGTIYNESGLNIEELVEVKKSKGSVINYKDGKAISRESLFELDVEVLIPGARPNVINEKNIDHIKAKYIVEAANIPIPYEVEIELHKRGVLILPDIIVNSGGVISSYVEYIHGTPRMAFSMIKEKIEENIKKILEEYLSTNESPRDIAMRIAKERVLKSMELRTRS